MRPSPGRNSGAFTLIEVLATLLLIGIVLPVAVDAILLSLATAVYAADRTEAASAAHTLMTDIIVGGEYEDAESTGRFGPRETEYQWSARWDEWNDPRLRRLTVTVTWQQRGRERDVTLSTLVYTRSGG